MVLLLRRPGRKFATPAAATVEPERIKRPDYYGSAKPDIMFVIDPLVGGDEDEAPVASAPISKKQFDFLTNFCRRHKIPLSNAAIIRACPPVTKETWENQKRLSDTIKAARDEFEANVSSAKPKLIIAMGKSAASQVLNRAAQITKIRGTPQTNEEFGCMVFPTLGVAHVMRIPENEKIFDADMATIKKVIDAGYQLTYQTAVKRDYRWVTDIQFLIDKADFGPLTLSADIEGVGLNWWEPSTRILTVQVATGPGVAYDIPIEYNHLNHLATVDLRQRDKLVKQLRTLFAHKNVKVIGQNFKFDLMMLRHKLGVEVKNYEDDTILLMHAVDENMREKSLDEITRCYVAPLAGYADDFNRDPIHEGKTRMDLVPPDKMLAYGCADVDSTWRCREALLDELKKDLKALNCHRRVSMPAMRAFADIEDHGFLINKKALQAFEKELRKHQGEEYQRLYRMVPREIRDGYLDTHVKKDRDGNVVKKASITRPGFLIQMIFKHPKGLRCKPMVFTKSTAKLKDINARVPSVSGKQHLAYFKDDHEFIAGIMEYIKNEKLLGTYVGSEDGDTIKGFYRYLSNGRIRPSYLLHQAVTGRTTSKNPNGQNFPKRGKLAKKYREIFVAPPGYVLIEVDQSQVELRIAAIMANDPTMLKLYRQGADIHAATAAYVMGISLAEFNELAPDVRSLKRFQAKACLALGTRVLTKQRGYVPIEDITLNDLLWDGVAWVRHEGVVYKGYRQVTTFDGITATPDHKVLSADGRKISIGLLASEMAGQGIAVSAIKGKPIRVNYDHRLGDNVIDQQEAQTCARSLRYLQKRARVLRGQSVIRQNHNLPLSESSEKPRHQTLCFRRSIERDLRRQVRRNKAALRKSECTGLSGLRGAGNTTQVQVADVFHPLGSQAFTAPDIQRGSDRSRKQQRTLRTGERSLGYAKGEPLQYAPVALSRVQRKTHQPLTTERAHSDRSPAIHIQPQLDYKNALSRANGGTDNPKRYAHVYDIVNAGPRHIFTAEDKLIFNCNFGFLYGMGWKKFMVYARTEYGITFTEEEARDIRNAFFKLYSNLKPWHEAVRNYVKEHGYVRALDGRVRHLPSVYSPDEKISEGAIRQAVNSPVQGFGSDLGLMAVALINQHVPKSLCRIIGFIHDSIVCIAPEDKAKEALQAVKYWMEHIPLKEWFNFDSPIPFVAEGSVGKNLATMIEVKDKWLHDKKVTTYYDVRVKQWEADCELAIKSKKPLPPRPVRTLNARRRTLVQPRQIVKLPERSTLKVRPRRHAN